MSRNLEHHANLLIGDREGGESYLYSLCKSLAIELANNPDFFVFQADVFGIEEARELKLVASRKALASQKIFLLAPTRLTLEAQNALLKVFEDPSPSTYFFLVTREEGLIIPTLRSRMNTVYIGKTYVGTEARSFLSMSVKSRLSFAKEFADDEKNLAVFLDGLLFLLREQPSVESVYNVRRFANDNSVLPRFVIEHLALVI